MTPIESPSLSVWNYIYNNLRMDDSIEARKWLESIKPQQNTAETETKVLTISMDLDGTLFDYLSFFKTLMLSFQSRGHKVGILTGHSCTCEIQDKNKLRALGFPEPDFYLGRTVKYMPLNGAHFKSDMIIRHGIDIHFDDYDYGLEDTVKLFSSLGQESHIFRVRSFRELTV